MFRICTGYNSSIYNRKITVYGLDIYLLIASVIHSLFYFFISSFLYCSIHLLLYPSPHPLTSLLHLPFNLFPSPKSKIIKIHNRFLFSFLNFKPQFQPQPHKILLTI